MAYQAFDLAGRVDRPGVSPFPYLPKARHTVCRLESANEFFEHRAHRMVVEVWVRSNRISSN